MEMAKLHIGAHRGAMGYAPENTLAAFETAIAQGAYRVEFDIRRTRDGHLVVIHDAAVDRTTDGSGIVADMDLAELQKLSSGGQQIPTFAQAIECMHQRTRMLVEFKDEDIAEQAVREIEAAGVVEQCALSSFHEPSLLQAHALNRDVQIAYFLVEPKPFDAAEIIDRFAAQLLIVWPIAAKREFLADAKKNGLHVRCGFRDDLSYEEAAARFKELAAMGVDEFSCGRPDWIGRMIEEYDG
jgi:glycerophosphoryl diester phosphodiesterase